MTGGPSPATRAYVKFVAVAIGVAVVVVAVGYFPTRNLAGAEAIPSMLAGCGVSVLGSIFGTIPIAQVRGGRRRDMSTTVMVSSAIRLAIVVVLAVAAAWSGFFQRVPLLIWVAISYLILLVVDTTFAVGSRPANTSRNQ